MNIEAIQVGDLRNCQMLSDHLSSVLNIERHTQVMPWARLSFEESLNRGDPCRVIIHQEKVLAFHVCSPVLDELHILNLAVAKTAQGLGLGHMLMESIVSIARENGATKIFLEVRESNIAAINLYSQWQFSKIAIRKKYYRTPTKDREDALVYVRMLDKQ